VLTLLDVEGPSLAEAIHQVKLAEKKSKVLVGGMTGALSKADLRALAEDLEDVEAGDLPPPRLARGDEPEPEPEPEPEQARWGKVSRSSRRGRGVEPAPEPRGRSRSESGRRTRRGAAEEPPSRSSRRGADSGRRIRRSRDSDPEERPARQMRRGAAKSSSRRTRRGADDSEDPRSRLRRSSRRGEEPEPSRSRRGRREPEPEPEPEEDRRDDTTSAAEALLARLRSSAGLNKTPKSTAKKATPTKPPPPQREALPQKPEPTDEVANVTSKAAGTDKQYYNISVNGGTPRRTKLKLGAPLAESAHKLSDALCGTPTDLTGHLTGWFRLEQGGQHWSGDQTSEVLDPDSVVDLVFVQNRVVPVTFRIEGAGEPMRFQAPVGTAVPVRSLVAHLKSWLNLPAGNWSLLVGGKPLGPLQILEDYTPDEGFEVVVRQ